jgi:hypothetical protein
MVESRFFLFEWQEKQHTNDKARNTKEKYIEE